MPPDADTSAGHFASKHRRNPLFMRALVLGFHEADRNGDEVLDYEEFIAALPSELRSADEATLREVFAMADADGDGTVTADEFFLWSLQLSADFAGASWAEMEKAFGRFDATGDGLVNLKEFFDAVEPHGFGPIAHKVFDELDRDHSGKIAYKEILATIQNLRMQHTISPDCRKLLTALAFSAPPLADATNEMLDLDSTPFVCESVDELHSVLKQRIQASNARPFDVWLRLLSSSAKISRCRLAKLPRAHFHTAVRTVFGYTGEPFVLDRTVNAMDDDGEDKISFDEFAHWITGTPHRDGRRRVSCGCWG